MLCLEQRQPATPDRSGALRVSACRHGAIAGNYDNIDGSQFAGSDDTN
ncbi:hypothetical protein [Candidatus Poriferisodalis sp.]